MQYIVIQKPFSQIELWIEWVCISTFELKTWAICLWNSNGFIPICRVWWWRISLVSGCLCGWLWEVCSVHPLSDHLRIYLSPQKAAPQLIIQTMNRPRGMMSTGGVRKLLSQSGEIKISPPETRFIFWYWQLLHMMVSLSFIIYFCCLKFYENARKCSSCEKPKLLN